MEHFGLPEVGSKWEVLVDTPRMAQVYAGDVVVVSTVAKYDVTYTNAGRCWTCMPEHWHTFFRPIEQEKAPTDLTAEASLGGCPSGVEYTPKDIKGKITSDGGPSEYYDFQNGWVTWNDLADYKATNQWKEHSFHLGNVGKVLMRWGDKAGATLVYDTHKLIYSGLRVLKMLVGVNKTREYLIRLLEDKQFKEGE